MARPATISSEQIVEAARKLFLENGFRVSTAAIAEAAGISEGSIFKRFASKEALFREAMGIPEAPIEAIAGLSGSDDPKAALRSIGEAILGFLRDLIPRASMLLAQPSFNPREMICAEDSPQPVRLLRALSKHLEEEKKHGLLCVGDPDLSARVILGAIHNYAFFEMVGINERLPMTEDQFLDGLIELIAAAGRPSKGHS